MLKTSWISAKPFLKTYSSLHLIVISLKKFLGWLFDDFRDNIRKIYCPYFFTFCQAFDGTWTYDYALRVRCSTNWDIEVYGMWIDKIYNTHSPFGILHYRHPFPTHIQTVSPMLVRYYGFHISKDNKNIIVTLESIMNKIDTVATE